ncbi:MAG: hypothetical protein FJW40_22295 [Acidobacteria bacterium]|nr:hypothetical protein [Acidobacteriota bacterium]
MPPLGSLHQILWFGVLLANSLLAFKLWRQGLHRTYRSFWISLLLNVLRSVVLMPLNPRSAAYGYIWLASEWILLVCFVLVIVEIHAGALAGYRGIATLSRRIFNYGLAAGILLSAAILMPSMADGQKSPLLVYTAVFERGVVGALSVFLVVLLAFLLKYPVPLNRNIAVHGLLFFIYFISKNLLILILQFAGYQASAQVSVFLMVLSFLCAAGWMVGLSPAGENVLIRSATPVPGTSAAKLLTHLEVINASLSRASRR